MLFYVYLQSHIMCVHTHIQLYDMELCYTLHHPQSHSYLTKSPMSGMERLLSSCWYKAMYITAFALIVYQT